MSMFIRGFLQSLLIVGILLCAGILGYQATVKQWLPKQEAAADDNPPGSAGTEEKPLSVTEPVTVASIDDISKNLIFCYDKKKGTVNKLVLEIFHSDKKQFTYITIPLTTQYTMTDTLYRKLVLVQPSIPQIIRLSSIDKYFDVDTVFDYSSLIIEDLLGIKISFYTAIPVKLYDTVFTEREDTEQEDTEVFTEEFRGSLKTIKSEQDLQEYIEDFYKQVETNLPLPDRLGYLDSYYATPADNVAFEQLEGEKQNSGFIPDEDKARQRLYELGAYD